MTTTTPRMIHMLEDTGARCDADNATYASSNRSVVTCPACLGAEPEPEPEPEVKTTPAPFSLEVTTPDELRAWRARYKLSQHKLARLLDVTGQTVMRWEKGSWPIPRMASYALTQLGQRLDPPC